MNADINIDDLMRQTNAEDSEKPVLEGCLIRAKATVATDINRPLTDLNDYEKQIFSQAVLQMATSFYLSRDGSGSGRGVTKSFAGLNSLIEALRKPPLGGIGE